MELLTGYTRLAENARLLRVFRAGFNHAENLRPLTRNQRAAYFLLALYYIAQDQSHSITSSSMPHTFLQVCLEGGARGITARQGAARSQLYMLGVGDGAAAPLKAEGAAYILIDKIM